MGWLFFDRFIRMGSGLFVGAWVARYLGPEQFGLFNFSIAFAALFGIASTLGLDGIVVRELVKDRSRQNEILGSAFVLKLGGSAITLMSALLVTRLIQGRNPLMLWLVGLASAAYVFQSLNVIDFYFQSEVRSKYTVYASNAAFALMTILKIILVLIRANLLAFAWVALGEAVLTAGFLIIAYRHNHHRIREWRYDGEMALELIKESWPLLLASLAAMLYMRLDVVMLQEMVGGREVGIYAAATRISEVWYFLPMVIVSSVSPSIINSHAESASLYIRRMKRLYFLMTWLAIGLSLPISLLSRWIVTLLYGHQFEAAGPVLAVHLWSSVAVFLGVASSQHLLVENLQRISFYRTLIGAATNIMLNLILIPRLGAMGAAIATLVSYSVATFSMICFRAARSHAVHLFLAPFVRS
jgi:polysaccharide transporter, PST family